MLKLLLSGEVDIITPFCRKRSSASEQLRNSPWSCRPGGVKPELEAISLQPPRLDFPCFVVIKLVHPLIYLNLHSNVTCKRDLLGYYPSIPPNTLDTLPCLIFPVGVYMTYYIFGIFINILHVPLLTRIPDLWGRDYGLVCSLPCS